MRKFWNIYIIVFLFHYASFLQINDDHKVDIKDVPYMVSISMDLNFCSGVILDELHILTNAHCMFYQNYVTNTNISVGSNYVNNSRIEVEQWFLPEYYRMYNYGNDTAVIKLKEPLIFNENISSIPLTEPDSKENNGDTVTIVGFGENKNTKNYTDLYKFNVKIDSLDKCNDSQIDMNHKICISYVDDNDICLGNDGSPLIQNGKVIGIALTNKCDDPDKPSMYTKIADYIDFINSILKRPIS